MPESKQRLPRQPLNSLATKIILFVFGSTFATALLVSWISIQSTHTYLNAMIDERFPLSIAHSAERLADWIASAASELETLAQSRSPLNATRLSRALADSSHFDGLGRISSNGKIHHAAGRAGEISPEEVRRWSQSPSPVLRVLATSSGEKVTALAVPLASGALFGVLDAQQLEAVLALHEDATGGVPLLVDAEGRVAHGSSGASRTVPLDALLADGGATVLEYTNSAGVHVIGSALPIGISDWYLVVEAPYTKVFAPVVSVIERIFVIDLCIILLFSYLAYKITSAIVKPIEVLSDGARRIAQGQLELEIPEPSTHDEIGLLARTFNDMIRKLRFNQSEIESANAKLRDQNLQLQQANEVLEQLSITDGLTKLHNHRFFQDHLTREIKRVNRVRKPLSMILVDMDDFKALNDRLGHAAGDELLRRVAGLMNDAVRQSDLLARYGGEEFVVLAPDTDIEGAQQLAEKIRMAIAESSFILDDSLRPTRTTVSIGVAQYAGNRKRFFADADRALYRAKAEGKNCVVVGDESQHVI